MARIRLLVRHADDAERLSARLRALGHEVDSGPLSPEARLALGQRPPDALVIDLSRQFSHGRDAALALRTRRATRQVPLVLAGGEPEKVARVRALLPDAVYTTWAAVGAAVRRAVARPPARPAVPASVLAGYSGTPLPRKLGIREGRRVRLLGAPPGFESTVGELPRGARLTRAARAAADLTIWFPRSAADLERRARAVGERAGAGGLWIAWPKQASGVATDLGERVVRAAGLAAGLVDYKICAIDATWSGLKFARRKPRGAPIRS